MNTYNAQSMKFLKKLREALGLSQYAMANKLEMLLPTYRYYETTAKGINLEALNHIRERLGMSWDDLGRLIEKEIKDHKASNKYEKINVFRVNDKRQ